MKSFFIRNHPMIRLSGRFDPAQEGFPMLWSASSAEMNVRGSSLEVQIDCAYRTHKPYLSFEVDGLRAQTFAPLPGKHWYSVFLHMKPDAVHTVRILKESQAFENDPSAGCVLLKGRTDGGLELLPPRRRKIEFIGDSLTSGEGGRGPQSFMEWVPMCFSASDNYTRFVADRLNAQYQLVSQSGWGVHCGWNNDPNSAIPPIYGQLCGLLSGEKNIALGTKEPYDFTKWQPNYVFINLGTNDCGAFSQPAWTDETTGETFQNRRTEDGKLNPEDEARFAHGATAFLKQLRGYYPNARLVWIYGMLGLELVPALQKAIDDYKAETGDANAEFLSLTDDLKNRGCRDHPGVGAHRTAANELIAYIKKQNA